MAEKNVRQNFFHYNFCYIILKITQFIESSGNKPDMIIDTI
jgi:hypothetical protein